MILDTKNFEISGVKLFSIKSYEDNRGLFSEVFLSKLDNPEFNVEYVQENESISNFGVFRGMHFQKPPYSERKIIYCSKGKILDVIVDLRFNSKTFLNIFQIELNESDNIAIDIPRGCCHGFLTLKHKSEMIYIHFDQYNKRKEYPIMYNDPILNINWPIKISNISNKDLSNFYLDNDFKGFKL